jgi:hypothetical protein
MPAMAAAAFWIALAIVLVANSWRSRHIEAIRHETIRLLIQKHEELDPEQIKNLLYPPHPPLPPGHPWAKRRSGEGYRVLRVFGTIAMIAAVGIGAMVAGIAMAKGVDARSAGIGVGLFVFLLGFGLFFASRHMPRPGEDDDGHPQAP